MSPEALGSMSAINPTPNVAYDFSTVSNRRSLPLIHQRRGATTFALRITPFQYLVSDTETCSQLIISAVFASTVVRLSCIHLVPGEPTWWPAVATKVIERRRCCFGICEK